MVKKMLVVTLLAVLALQGSAAAIETGGDVVFKDSMYGLVIGAVLGGAVYLIDDDHLAQKLGVGIAIGTVGGLIYGLSETRSVVAMDENGKIRIAFPTPEIQKTKDATKISVSLLNVAF